MAHLTFLVFVAVLGVSSGNPVWKFLDANNKPNNRIVNGQEAQRGDFPYQVSLQAKVDGHFCGGSILNHKWILTAAHCVFYESKLTFYTVVGVTNWTNLGTYGSKHDVEEIIIHPEFDMYNPTFDLGLIKVKESIEYSEDVKNVNLPSSDLNTQGLSVVASGWGRLISGGKVPQKLQYIDTLVYDNKSCAKRMLEIDSPFEVTDKHICTLTKEGEGVCQGDSGGPIVAGDVQIGIVSWGSGCARGLPDVHVNVWSHVSWIKSHINEQ